MEKRQQSDDEKHVDPKAKLENWEPSPLPPIAPDGGFAPQGVGNTAVIPDWTPENTMCLRGPCRHYWHLVTMTEAGNPEGTWEELGIKEPQQHSHTCLVQLGIETDLGENCVFECSKWEPLTHVERDSIDIIRKEYFDEHPEHRDDESKDNVTDDGISGIESSSDGFQGEFGEID